MDLAEKFKQLKNNQQKLLKEYEDAIEETESSIILVENEKLKKQLIKHNEFLKKLKEEHHKLLNENQNLKLSLNEQIIDEKLKIIKISQNRLNLFFKREKLQNTDRLTNFEQETKKHITILKNKVQSSIHEDQETFLKEIENLNLKISEKLRKQREELITEENKLYAHTKKGLNNFSKEGVDEEIIQKRVRQNKIEMKIGLSWINKIGIFLILLGVGFAAYYNREYIDDYLKGAFYFLLGIAFLIGGEILYRQKNDVFAKGLLGGGIAILYGSIFISCFMLKIISLNIGFLIAFIITSTAIILSLRYNSKTIISFKIIKVKIIKVSVLDI